MRTPLFSLPRVLLLGALVIGTIIVSHAQAPGNSGTTGGPPPPAAPTPTPVPLDGGASLLLVSGVAYGLRRLRRRRAQ